MSLQYLELNVIEELANDLRLSSGIDGTKYVDVEKIASALGFKVYEAKFQDETISGKVINTLEGKEILVSDEPFERQRFTIAHEIGHIILHHKPNDIINMVDYRSAERTYDPKEFQADAFAAALLMPRDTIARAWSDLKDVDDVAAFFKVSKKAASIRLMNLELI